MTDARLDSARELPLAMRSRLRTATAEMHATLEARLDLTSPHLTLERYRRILVGFHGYHRAIEPRLVALAGALRVSLPIVTRTVALERV